ncbi:MAG: LysR substrate-binding domain-containing protein [Candidatus Binatia bacterium]
MPPWNELGVFARVVSAGGFSAAAADLGLSKAAISDHVRRLEQRLGVRLLNRTTRSLSLTAAGEACYRHCLRLIEEGTLAERAAVALHKKPMGLLRVTAPATFGAMHVAPAVAALMRENPRLDVELSLSTGAADLVREHFDLAVRIGPLASSSLVARRIATVRQIVTAAPDYLHRRGIPTSLADLASHDALQFTPLGWGNEWRLAGPGVRGERRVEMRVRFASDSGEALVAAACAGLGLALLPNWMVYREIARAPWCASCPAGERGDAGTRCTPAPAAPGQGAPASTPCCATSAAGPTGRSEARPVPRRGGMPSRRGGRSGAS